MHVDGHIHLSFIPREQRANFFSESHAMGVGSYIMGGYNPPDWEEQKQLQQEFKSSADIATCFGLHPWHIMNSSAAQLSADFNVLTRLVASADFVGETGIDRFTKGSPQKDKLQIEYFRKHLDLAAKHSKPVILHIVKAHTDALEILNAHRGLRGIVHGYAGAPELALRYSKLGYFISVGPGVLAQKGYRKLKETVADFDLKELVLESDSPQSPQDLTPNPQLLLKVASAVAKIKRTTREKVLQASNENLLSLIG